MMDWTAGYVADIGYTFGYYRELNPLLSRLAFLNAGLLPPTPGTHCELGYGQGLSVNIHAAAGAGVWYGNDFNPSQAGFARTLALASGAEVHLTDEAFSEFCQRGDLPDFDSIGLHGVWSWISDENRGHIVDFIRRKLKVGGVLYVSYNTQPGWASMLPMRDLLVEYGEAMNAKGMGTAARVDSALGFAEKLLTVSPRYARANPSVPERIAQGRKESPNYVAHEYFNRDWLPMSFTRMAQWLQPAKLEYACSAHYLDHIDALNLSEEQQASLAELPDPMFRQTVRDFMLNQQFRRDYWVKGARSLSALEKWEMFHRERIMLAEPRDSVPLTAKGTLEGALQPQIYTPILDALADHRPQTLEQLAQGVQDHNIEFRQLVQAVVILTGSAYLCAAQDEAAISRARPIAARLNAHFMEQARVGNTIGYLASPVSGGGHSVPRFQQLFLRAIAAGKAQPAEWAQEVWQVLEAQGEKILKDGKPLESAAENIAELTQLAQAFAAQRLPILKALGIA